MDNTGAIITLALAWIGGIVFALAIVTGNRRLEEAGDE